MEELIFVHLLCSTGETVVKCADSVKTFVIEFHHDSHKVKRIEVERTVSNNETIHNTSADRQAD